MPSECSLAAESATTGDHSKGAGGCGEAQQERVRSHVTRPVLPSAPPRLCLEETEADEGVEIHL